MKFIAADPSLNDSRQRAAKGNVTMPNDFAAAPLHGVVRRSVFAFEFCFCRFESGFSIESLHSTKAGAYRAMMEHKRQHWYESREGRYCDAAEIGWMEMWRVKEYTVAD